MGEKVKSIENCELSKASSFEAHFELSVLTTEQAQKPDQDGNVLLLLRVTPE